MAGFEYLKGDIESVRNSRAKRLAEEHRLEAKKLQDDREKQAEQVALRVKQNQLALAFKETAAALGKAGQQPDQLLRIGRVIAPATQRVKQGLFSSRVIDVPPVTEVIYKPVWLLHTNFANVQTGWQREYASDRAYSEVFESMPTHYYLSDDGDLYQQSLVYDLKSYSPDRIGKIVVMEIPLEHYGSVEPWNKVLAEFIVDKNLT